MNLKEIMKEGKQTCWISDIIIDFNEEFVRKSVREGSINLAVFSLICQSLLIFHKSSINFLTQGRCELVINLS